MLPAWVKSNYVWLRCHLHKQNLSSKHKPSIIAAAAPPINNDLKIDVERKEKKNKIKLPIIQ